MTRREFLLSLAGASAYNSFSPLDTMSCSNPSNPGQIASPPLVGDTTETIPYYTQEEIDTLLESKADLENGKLAELQDFYGPEVGWTNQDSLFGANTLTPSDFGTLFRAIGAVDLTTFDPINRNGRIGIYVLPGGTLTLLGATSVQGDEGSTSVSGLALTPGLYILHAVQNVWVLEGYARYLNTFNDQEFIYDGISANLNYTLHKGLLTLKNGGEMVSGFMPFWFEFDFISDGTGALPAFGGTDFKDPSGATFHSANSGSPTLLPRMGRVLYQKSTDTWTIITHS